MTDLRGYDDWKLASPEPGLDPSDFPHEKPCCIRCGEERVRVTVFAGAPNVICDDCGVHSSEAASEHLRWLPLFTGEWETEGRDAE